MGDKEIYAITREYAEEIVKAKNLTGKDAIRFDNKKFNEV